MTYEQTRDFMKEAYIVLERQGKKFALPHVFNCIEALEKQIPKKPIEKHYEEFGEHPYIKYACPDCKSSISVIKENEKAYQNRFCHKCGQAIYSTASAAEFSEDWSEEE